MAEIELRNLCKQWGDFIGVNDVNLTIADREFLVLLGPCLLYTSDAADE